MSKGVIGFGFSCSISAPFDNVVNIYDSGMDFMRGGKTNCRIFHILIGKEKGEMR